MASFSLQIIDFPKEPILFTLNTIYNMVHLFRTSLGNSKYRYDSDKWDVPIKPPPQGIGQGNWDDPSIWSIVSITLLDCIRESGHRAAFKCCLSVENLNLVGYLFVNDVTIIQVDTPPNTPTKDSVKLSQKGLEIVTGVIQATGLHVSMQKTKCFLLGFIWELSGKWYLDNNKAQIFIPNPTGRQSV